MSHAPQGSAPDAFRVKDAMREKAYAKCWFPPPTTDGCQVLVPLIRTQAVSPSMLNFNDEYFVVEIRDRDGQAVLQPTWPSGPGEREEFTCLSPAAARTGPE